MPTGGFERNGRSRDVGPWLKQPRGSRGLDSISSRVIPLEPDRSLPPIMALGDFIDQVRIPIQSAIIDARNKTLENLESLREQLPDIFNLNLRNHREFAMAAHSNGFVTAARVFNAQMQAEYSTNFQNHTNRDLSALMSQLNGSGIHLVRTVADRYAPQEGGKGGKRIVDKKKVAIDVAEFGVLAGLACGLVETAVQTAVVAKDHHGLVFICADPGRSGDQQFDLKQFVPLLDGVAKYHNINSADAALVNRLGHALSDRFGINDVIICSPGNPDGVSPVITQVNYFNPTGEGNLFVLLDDGRLVGPKQDSLFTPDNKWIQKYDVAHYSMGRASDGKFDSIVYTAPQKNPTDPEQIVGVLDRETGQILTGKTMVDKFSRQFSNINYAVLSSLDVFQQSIPTNLRAQVDHFGYAPAKDVENNLYFKLVAFKNDGSVLWSQGQEATASVAPTPTSPVVVEAPKTPTAPATPTVISPTETPKPSYVWSTNFDQPTTWNNDGKQRSDANSYYQIVDDPSNSGRGKVYEAIVQGPVPKQNTDGRHRPYPDIFYPYKAGAYSMQVDAYLDKDLKYTKSSDGHIMGILGAFNSSPIDKLDYHVQLQVNLRDISGKKMLTLMLAPNESDPGFQIAMPYEADAPEFTLDDWHTARVNVNKDGTVELKQDGRVVSKGVLSDWEKKRIGSSGGHTGLYARNNLLKARLLNDNFSYTLY